MPPNPLPVSDIPSPSDLTASVCPILPFVWRASHPRTSPTQKQQAVTLERIGDTDRADEFDGMSVDEYAEIGGFRSPIPDERKENEYGNEGRIAGSA